MNDPKFVPAKVTDADRKAADRDAEKFAQEGFKPEGTELTEEEFEGASRFDAQGRVNTEVPAHAMNDSTQIVHIQRFIGQDGQPAEVKHGPMPQSEWTAYAAKKGL